MKKIIRERKHRLPIEYYRGIIAVHFTLCIKKRSPVLSSPDIFSNLETILKDEMVRHKIESEVYLFMPDHAHFLLRGVEDDSNVYHCVKAFKQTSGYWFAEKYRDISWQKDFYDHIVRKNENIHSVIKYILSNPIRKELVEDWKEYQYKGSTIYDFSEWD